VALTLTADYSARLLFKLLNQTLHHAVDGLVGERLG
jgi:hypothetical protein